MFRRVFFVMILMISSCKNSGFQGSSSESTGSQDANPETCVEGDRVTLPFPKEIQGCIEQNRIYSFYDQVCLETQVAPFPCSFDAVIQKVKSIGVGYQSLEDARSQNALLVACSEKNQGRTVIAQWIFPKSDDPCELDLASREIVTACYRLNVGGSGKKAETPEEISAMVDECLKS
ncbi:hypothetical protein [Pseudobacteriovorax antillogorgiicola]|uniref:Uncharacterized protein n=1 Tax=Pseudobacteriovorax antillogorgiicola TaxID=1513793 RepID=A0A1Y6CLL8_9BACT|nr:hypothetical protein [Pseudobacteriovorax antillogorgiicola]TCS47253.1 hypothetical protein EDD56_12128 [Pseudobacteriovorax antillogorgiicola]SMF62061.1 hypothetical protein SAMN06296036_12128 [Pseudobacteriovorax antillogorgiicola]